MNKKFEVLYRRLQKVPVYSKPLPQADELTKFRTQRAFDNANRIKTLEKISKKGW